MKLFLRNARKTGAERSALFALLRNFAAQRTRDPRPSPPKFRLFFGGAGSRPVRLLWSILLPVIAAAQTWTPFTAHYVETNTVRDANGVILTQTRKDLYEVRDADGSLATFQQIDGRNVSGSIWLACGDTVALNYTNKTATISHDPRRIHKHFQIPQKDNPLGTTTIAGLNVTGWPVHFSNGTGAMWVDVNNDIVAKTEAHLDGANGVRTDYIKELNSIDLNSPVDRSKTKLPAGFALNANGEQQSCGNF